MDENEAGRQQGAVICVVDYCDGVFVVGGKVAQLAEMTGLAFGIGDLGQKSGPRNSVETRSDQTRPRPAQLQLQLQLQLPLRTYLGLNIMVIEMALCGCFHAVLSSECFLMLSRLASRAWRQVES